MHAHTGGPIRRGTIARSEPAVKTDPSRANRSCTKPAEPESHGKKQKVEPSHNVTQGSAWSHDSCLSEITSIVNSIAYRSQALHVTAWTIYVCVRRICADRIL